MQTINSGSERPLSESEDNLNASELNFKTTVKRIEFHNLDPTPKVSKENKPGQQKGLDFGDQAKIKLPSLVKNQSEQSNQPPKRDIQIISNGTSPFLNPKESHQNTHNAQFPTRDKSSLKNVLNYKNIQIVDDQFESARSNRSSRSKNKKSSKNKQSREGYQPPKLSHGHNHSHGSQISISRKKSSATKELGRKRTMMKRQGSMKRQTTIKRHESIKKKATIRGIYKKPEEPQKQEVSDSIKSSSNLSDSEESSSQYQPSSYSGSYGSESSFGSSSQQSSSDYQDFNKEGNTALARAKSPDPQHQPETKVLSDEPKSLFAAAADGLDKIHQKLDKKRRLAAANTQLLDHERLKQTMTDQGDNFKLDKMKRQTTVGKKSGRQSRSSMTLSGIDFDNEQTLEKTAAHRFEHYQKNFMELTKRNLIETKYEVLSIMISNDNQRVICLFCNKEQQQQNFIIVTYDSEKPKRPKQKIQIYGDYLLADEFAQSKKGERYCLPYFDTGNFKIHVFDQYDDKIIRIENINENLKISNDMDPELGFTTPCIHVIFINQNLLFVNVYDQHKKINYHFQYSLKSFAMVGQPISTNLKKQLLNYPINLFFSPKADEYYIIYRHGQFITLNNVKGIFQAKNEDMAKAFRQSLFGIGQAAPGGPIGNNLLGSGLIDGGLSKESKANPLLGLGVAKLMTKVGDGESPNIDLQPDGIRRTGTKREKKFYKHSVILQFRNQGLEQCLFFQGQFLVTKHSNSILFFKRENGIQTENFSVVQGIEKGDVESKQWHLFYTLQVAGHIFYSGPKEMSVTTETKIHFYEFDSETFEPCLKGLVNNFMACNRMVVGPDNNVILSYQTNQTDFMMYRRSNHHKFISLIDKKPILYCQTLSLGTFELFCISSNTLIEFHDINSYQVIGQIDILHDQEIHSDQALSVLMMKSDETQSTMVCLIGFRLLESKYKVTNISVHSLSHKSETKMSYAVGARSVKAELKMPEFKCLHFNSMAKFPCEFSTNFEICKKNPKQILISDAVALWTYNYETEQLTLKHEYQQILIKSPDFFVFNEDQSTLFVSCTKADHVFKNIERRQDYDFDIDFKANEIRACINANQKFYVLANKIEGQHGIYLIEFDQDDPSEYSQQEATYVMKWPQKLEIGSADIYYCDYENDDSLKSQSTMVKGASSKQIVLCFKTIYVNTFTVIVIGLGEGSNNIILRHETFHMWESFVKGLLLPSLDFFILQNQGIKAIKLGYQEKQRKIKDSNGDKVKMHSLHNCDYLKINPTNHILFTYSLDETQVEIHVLDLNRESKKLTSMITEIYKILIEQLNLSELMLLQGLFSCSSQGRLATLISEFPNQPVFFKSLLEFDMTNLISILSFDSRSIESLLNDSNKQFFRKDYPVFYKLNDKNQNEKQNFKSAIDVALYNSQIQGLNKILEYIVKYQNSIMHSYLFEDNFIKMLSWDINVIPLLNSKILFEQFDFDQWPNIHHDETKMIEPYNESIFNVSQQYPKVFHFLTGCHDEHASGQSQGSLVHKIKYTLSVLPNMRDEQNDVSLIDMLATTDQIDVFSTKPVQSIIQFKWDRYSQKFHKLFASIHMVYLLTFLLYVNEIYINGRFEHQPKMLLLMLLCNMTASFYDLFQLKLTGFLDYFTDIWNYVDILHVYIGYINLYYQFSSNRKSEVMQTHVKIFILLSTLMMLIKTFFFLRIVQGLTQFVIMVKQVIADLRYFVFFYLLFVLMFSLVLAVLGIRNKSWEHHENEHRDHRQLTGDLNITSEIMSMYDARNLILEQQIPPMLGNFIQIFRFSLADFDFSIINTSSFTQLDVSLFWISWLLIVLITNIVFLNFIIAEVSNSYANVQCSVKQLILRERASLINESEQMMENQIKRNPNLFPKFMIIREVDQ